MNPKKRIPVSAPQPGLQSPFSGLSLAGLPEGSVPEEKLARPAPGRIVLRREKAHRGGKAVIVVQGFHEGIFQEEIERLAGLVRRKLGCGGTVRDREVEIQGDNPAAVRKILQAEGFRVDGV
mgnify:FL=1